MELPRTPSFRLDGKSALVTGGSSGIGQGCAVALAEAGAKVIVAARKAGPVGETVEAIRGLGFKAEPQQLDVAEIKATGEIVESLGPIDILVNSAGIARHAPAVDTEPGDYDAVMDTNLKGAYFLTRNVAKGLIEAGKPGSLINISSQMGHVGGIDRGVYCATKFAVEGFTKSLAIEFGPKNIRVNTLAPTFIRTPLAEQTLKNPKRRQWIESMIKLPRIGEIEDIMGGVVYLASDASAMVTGTSLLIDGGWTAD